MKLDFMYDKFVISYKKLTCYVWWYEGGKDTR